jgi:HD superfamily phosphohydrolase
VDFYDPLYDFVTFEEAVHQRGRDFWDVGFARKGADTHGESISPLRVEKVILPFLSAVEFTRQSFLRQSGLAFLVYPSASHTRLAHSVGACYLGFLSSQRVAIGEAKQMTTEPPAYLSEFLEKTRWREEFYLALLLHDIGHFPFSHSLENNKELWEALNRDIHHEEAACQIIKGNGPIFEASVRRVRDLRKNQKKRYPHLSELFREIVQIDKDVICYLISGKAEEHLSGKTPRQVAELRVVHALVSGLLDLDRIDHYRRDNLFTGLRTGTSPNFPSLLSGLTICYDPDDLTRPLELRLSYSAIGPAISLLQAKERLTEDCFEHPDNVAYEVMLNQAFNMYLFGDDFYESNEYQSIDERSLCDLLVTTDDELLLRMNQDGTRAVKEIVFRIMNRAPYRPIAKLSFPLEHRRTLRDIRAVISSAAKIKKTNIVLRPSKGFGVRNLKERPEEWLDLERLLNSEGKRLVESKYRRQIEHFKQAQDPPDLLWLYCPDDKSAAKLGSVVHEICQKLDCRLEDIR